MYEKPDDAITFCACMGPMYGEPLCPCAMSRAGLERSQESKDALVAANKRLDELFGKDGEFFKQPVSFAQLI